MLIRHAIPDDAPALIRMACAFHSASGCGEFLAIDIDSLVDTLRALATSPDCVLFVAEQDGVVCGMAAAMSHSHWLNQHHKAGQEMFWWVDEAARGSAAGRMLMQGLEAWALEVGCNTFTMATTATLRPEAVARVYRRAGYVPQDIFYVKAIKSCQSEQPPHS